MPREGVKLNFRLLDAFRHAAPEEADPAPPTDAAQELPAATTDGAEAALIALARQDPAAFGKLYELYVDRIYAYILHRVGNVQDAEDLTARTFYRALDHFDTYEERGAPFGAWLFRIAHNLVANWHRDRSRRSFLSLDRLWSHSADGAAPDRQVEQQEESAALWQAVSRLPEERRNLLAFKFGAQLSNLEIGELMNKSESAIKSLYFRTLAALRQDLEARGWGGGSSPEPQQAPAQEIEGESE
jgi:RNA polymerase sigma-70 factor (ECF subfamily)